jgi:hypothetical protein
LKINENLIEEEKAKLYGQEQHRGVFILIILSHGILVDRIETILGTDCKPGRFLAEGFIVAPPSWILKFLCRSDIMMNM